MGLDSLDLLEPSASTKQLDCLNICKFISTALSKGLKFTKGKKDVHAFDVSFFAIGARRIWTCSRDYEVLEITTNTRKSIRSALGTVIGYNPVPPSHPTCPTSGELLTGWLGLTSRSSRVRSCTVASVDCSRIGDTSRGHCWEGREKSQSVATIDLLLILNSGQRNVKRVRCKCATNSARKDGTTGADLDLQRSPMLRPYSGWFICCVVAVCLLIFNMIITK